MKIQVDKGIPLPTSRKIQRRRAERTSPGRPPKYPWKDMEVGDSFLIDRPLKSVNGLAGGAGIRYNMKFATRKIDENSTRIWRVA